MSRWWRPGAASLLLCLLPLAGAGAGAGIARYDFSADAMGGTFLVTVYADSRARAEASTDAAFSELRRLDRMLSHYRPDSPWSEVNRRAAVGPVRVPPELFEVVAASLDCSRRSGGAFDITVGPLVRAWGFMDEDGRPAEAGVVREAAARVGYRHVRLDAATRTIRFTRAGLELDPGGIGKGYAVDRMAMVLRAHGIGRALISAAGSSLLAMGSPPGLDGWAVTIGGHTMAVPEGRLALKDASLSTSGSTTRFVRRDGAIHGHVIDPRTGQPAGSRLAAVVAPRGIDSEAWTKAVLVNGREWSVRHTPPGWRVLLCESALPSSCAWIHPG